MRQSRYYMPQQSTFPFCGLNVRDTLPEPKFCVDCNGDFEHWTIKSPQKLESLCTLAGEIKGICPYGSLYVVFTSSNIYKVTADGAATDITPTGWSATAVQWAVGTDLNGVRWVLATNGDTKVVRWNGTGSFEACPAIISGFTGCRSVAFFHDRFIYGGIKTTSWEENAVIWSEVGDLFVQEDLSYVNGNIKRMLPLGDSLIVYTSEGGIEMRYVGGDIIFGFFPQFSAYVVDAISDGSVHFVVRKDGVLLNDGNRELRDIGSNINRLLSEIVDDSLIMGFDAVRRKVVFSNSKGTLVYYRCPDCPYGSVWSRWDKPINALAQGTLTLAAVCNGPKYGRLSASSQAIACNAAGTETVAASLIGDSNILKYQADYNSLDDGFVLMPDIITPEYTRWHELEFEARGEDLTVYVGDWTQSISLSSEYEIYRLPVQYCSNKTSVKFEGKFEVRWYRLWFNEGGR